MNPPLSSPSIAIACGGTGGHLFPGLAVGRALGRLGCRVSLFVSSKGIDQTAVANIADLAVVTLPAVAQQDRNYITFARSMARAWSGSKAEFRRNRPDAVLAMGGFTSCPVVFAGASTGALTFLHESNTIPGRANRLLAHWVDECFVGFPEAAGRLWNPRVTWTGTPSRDGFVVPTSAQVEASRIRLGLDPQRPVLLVTGGSQGARGLNKLFLGALPQLVATMPSLQYIHLTGEADVAMAEEAHAKLRCRSVLRPFLAEIDAALMAATAVVSRAGASSIAELAAMRLPSLLIPLPTAQDNHQFFNAQALAGSGAAVAVDQDRIHAADFALAILRVVTNPVLRQSLSSQIGSWHVADSAERIATRMLQLVEAHRRGLDSTAGASGDAPARRTVSKKRTEVTA